jgi:hypothetical protein
MTLIFGLLDVKMISTRHIFDILDNYLLHHTLRYLPLKFELLVCLVLTINLFILYFQMEPVNKTCVTCCDGSTSDESSNRCCDCNAKHDACSVTQISDEEERSTRKRSSWNNEVTQHSSSVTFFILCLIFIVVLASIFVWRRCRRHDAKRRFRFRDGRIRTRNRIQKSPLNNSSQSDYQILPLTEPGY